LVLAGGSILLVVLFGTGKDTYDPRIAGVPIKGLRLKEDPGHNTYEVFDRWEGGLWRAIEDRVFDEVIVLLRAGYWQSENHHLLVRKAESWSHWEMLFDGQSVRRRRREMVGAEVVAFREWLVERGVDLLEECSGPWSYDGLQYEYVRVNREGGTRLFMNNPCVEAASVFCEIVERFSLLSQTGEYDEDVVDPDVGIDQLLRT
jgi:hypothetical protein